MAYAIMRVAQLNNKSRGKGSIGGSIRHLEHHKESAEISKPELTHLNRSLTPKDYPKLDYKICKELASELKARHNKAVDEWNNSHEQQKRHLKENTSQFFEAVFSFSSEANGSFEVSDWCNKTFEFVKEEFIKRGCKVIKAELHCDEEQIHVHALFLSYDSSIDNCTSRNILGNKEGNDIMSE
jgi:hypothetical protein